MKQLVDKFLTRFRPQLLRSNDPKMPLKTGGKHWLFEETRFLLLTRRGPVEIVVKPTYVAAAAFVGLVGTGVITAATLFIGYNAVEKVSNDTISTAEASIPGASIPGASIPGASIPGANIPGASITGSGIQLVEPADIEDEFKRIANQQNGLENVLLAARTPDTDIAEVATLGSGPTEPDETSVVAELTTMTMPKLMPPPPKPTPVLPENAAPPATGSAVPTASTALLAMLKAPFTSPFKNSISPFSSDKFETPEKGEPLGKLPAEISGKLPEDVTETLHAPGGAITIVLNPPRQAGMVPFSPNSQMPVVNAVVRQQKLLRSMVREVRNIRSSLTKIGIDETNLPPESDLMVAVGSADFATLMMSVEAHRSALRKVPLKPPMLYFYISSNYGNRKHPVTGKVAMHHGIDLAGTWQENVHASAPGVVVYAGKLGSFGNVVRIQHDFDVVTTYAHLSRITVKKDADVTHGTVIGKMGRTGRVAGAHLHYEIRVGRKSLNPQKFFDIGHRIGVSGALMQASAND